VHAMKAYGGAERLDTCERQLYILDILHPAKCTQYPLIIIIIIIYSSILSHK